MTQQDHYKENLGNQSDTIKKEKKNNVVDAKTLEIVKAFQDEKLQGNSSYFSSDKRNVIADFRAYVTEHYGDGMLITLQKEGKIDHAFNEIADRGFTIADFFNTDKKETIRQQIGNTIDESQAISQSCMDCYTNWSKLSEDSKKKIPFDDFISEIGYDVKRDEHNNIISMSLKKVSKIQSISALDTSRKEFVRTKTDNNELIKVWDNCMDISHFDPTEKIVCITTVRSLYDRIQKIDGSKRKQLNELLENIFGKKINTNTSLSALTSWTNLSGLQSQLEDFFAQLSHIGLTEKEVDSLKSLSIDPEKCLHYGEKSKELASGTHEKTLQIKKFSELDKKVQKICDKLVSTNIINTVDKVIDTVETDIKKIGTLFDMPGSMSGFFKQFTPDLDKISVSDRQEYQDLKNHESSYREKISDATAEERTRLLGEYQSLRQKIAEKEKKYYAGTTIDFFESIGKQVTQANTTIGKSNDLLGGQVSQVLQKLYQNGRDMSVLSTAEQNIFMRASVAMQLAKVKNEGGINAMGYDFEQYAQFVSELYDFTSERSVLTTKDGQTIDLNFTKKRYVGKPNPYPGEIIDITSGFKQGLDALHIEFELDIKDNPDAADFLKMLTGGKSSQLFQKITDQTGREQLITESSRVEMTGPDGQKYQGYLSPALLDDMSLGDDDISKGYSDEEKDSMKTSSNTFVLYSKPVDQFHDDREVKTKEGSSLHGKLEPIYINPSNAKDWKIDILDHRVTLNDAKINVLPLGHIMAQEYDKQQLLAKEITERQDSDIEKNLNSLKNINFHDKDANPSPSENIAQASEVVELQKDRNAMFPDNNKEGLLPKEGMRFALQVDNVVTSKIGADDPKLLSATVKKIADDGSITFSFDTLTRSGQCSLKDITLQGAELSKFKDKTIFKNIIYLGTNEDTNKPYPELLTHLSNTFEKDKNKYNFGLFSGLDLKDGKIIKGKDPVSFIIPADDENNNYYIEYTVEKSGDHYHVKSTGYDAEVKGSDGKKKNIETSFDMKTDLSGVLLLLAGKNIAPYTSDEKKILTTEHGGDTLPQKDRRSRSISTLWAVLKSGGKSAMDGLKKKRGEKQEEELKFILFNEMDLYRKMSDGPLGTLLGKFDLNPFDDLANDAAASGIGYGWEKINKYREYYKKFNLVKNAWVGGEKGNFGEVMLHSVVKKAYDSVNSKGTCSAKDRRKCAAVLLQLLDKMKGTHFKSFGEFPKGAFIKILLGPEAYKVFTHDYHQLEIESKKPGGIGYAAKDQLIMLEYEFLVHHIGGGSNANPSNATSVRDKGIGGVKNPFYFQNIYGRGYVDALRPLVGKVKEISAESNSEDAKKHFATNNFGYIYGECKNHIKDMRASDAVGELIALQKLAKTKDEADKVIVLLIAGILNGLFVDHIGRNTKMGLKGILRNSAIPFPHWIEDTDIQQKIQTMLQLATANKGDKAFKNFKYIPDKSKEQKDYSILDFGGLHPKRENMQGVVDGFVDWMGEVGDQVIPFLHMDAESLNTDDNLIKIRKSYTPELKIFGEKVTPEAKGYVDSIMRDFYTNRDRGASLDNYNYYSGYTHNTMIEQVITKFNKHNGQDRDGTGDHADTFWGHLKDHAPSGKEKPTSKDMLSYHINEFFRVFQGFGSLKYESGSINNFYKQMRLAKNYTGKDRSRIIRFYMTQSLFSGGLVPEVVSDTFTKYMKYFEENLENFDLELGKLHPRPGDHSKTFEASFIDSLEDTAYYTKKEWNTIRLDNKLLTSIKNDCRSRDVKLLNADRDDQNTTARGNTRSYNNQGNIEMTIDKKIQELQGRKIGSDDGNYMVSTVRAKNNTDVDRTVIANNKPKISDKSADIKEILKRNTKISNEKLDSKGGLTRDEVEDMLYEKGVA